jgi:hypothetical protein
LKWNDDQRINWPTSWRGRDFGKNDSRVSQPAALDERVSLYLRAVRGKQDFGPTDSSNARNDILDAMAADVAVKLGMAPQRNRGLSPPRDLPDTSGLQAEGPPYLMGASFRASIEDTVPDVDFVMAAQARPHFADLAAPAGRTIRPAELVAQPIFVACILLIKRILH